MFRWSFSTVASVLDRKHRQIIWWRYLLKVGHPCLIYQALYVLSRFI